MEQQINQAVAIALSRDSDQGLKTQAIDFINQIKSTKEGYESCLQILFKDQVNEEFKFFIYQVIEENLGNLSDKDSFELDQLLFEHFQRSVLVNKSSDSTYIKNKFVNVLSKIFCKNYLTINPNFLKNWLELIAKYELTELSVVVYDYYLRLMISIHEEIADKLISRDNYVNERNTYLKDKIRLDDMKLLIESWYKILQVSYSTEQSDNLNHSLVILGQYVQWMEISLFISEKEYLQLINSILVNKLNNQCCFTIIEIISKKMKPNKKIELLELFDITNLLNSLNISNLNLDFMENLSKLVNIVCIENVSILGQLPADLSEKCFNQLINYWPFVFTFLSNEYDEISYQVFPFIQTYLSLSKKNGVLVIKELFETLLNKIVLKMKYDVDLDEEDDDLISEFKEFRTKLKGFQDLIGGILPELYLNVLPTIINESLFGNSWNDVELGLYELLNFNDSLKNNVIGLPKSEIQVSKPMEINVNFFIKLINEISIDKFSHELNQLNLFEIILKFYSNLTNDIKLNEEFNVKILNVFISPIGIYNKKEKVKFRCWYLFFRLVKLIKPDFLTNEMFLNDLFINLNNLLAIKPDVNEVNEENEETEEIATFNNQLYLFESIGYLISIYKVNDDLKLKFLSLILEPIFNDLENLMKLSSTEKLVILQMHHDIMAIGTFVKGYHYELRNRYSPPILEKFLACSQSITIILVNFGKFELVRDSCKFTMARLIPILKELMVNDLNKLVTVYLTNDLKVGELAEFIAFVNQIIHSYQDNENIYNLLNNLLTPLINKILETIKYLDSINSNNEYPELNRDKIYLKKSMLTLISIIIMNHQTSLFITESNKLMFKTLIDQIFETTYNLQLDEDYAVNKLAVLQLANLIGIFKQGKIIDSKDKFLTVNSAEGIDDYLISNCVELVFKLSFEFNVLNQQNKSLIQELASLLKALQLNHESFVTTLSKFLQENGINEQLRVPLIENMVKLDSKAFRPIFIQFITELKTQ